MERITLDDLEELVTHLNEITGSPKETNDKDENGFFITNVGNYHVTKSAIGFALNKIVNKSGGTEKVLGYVPKRELYDQIEALIKGILIAQNNGEHYAN